MESDGPPQLSDCESLPPCPSFNSYTSQSIAEIASKVTREVADPAAADDDFEFDFVRTDSHVTGDEIFCFGGFGEIFPVFNRDLVAKYEHDRDGVGEDDDDETIRLPLGKLFMEEREDLDRDPPSSSSSEVDELDSVPQGTYCVWRPKPDSASVAVSPSRCEKSKSTGSVSKRWNFRDLLRRSNSDGKEAFVFFTPKNRDQHKAGKIESAEKPKERRNSGLRATGTPSTSRGGDKMSPSPSPSPSRSAHEAFYVQSRASREGEKKKSYLPYRKDLVGFFANVHGMGRTFPPF